MAMNLSRWLKRNAKMALWRVFPLVLLASLADAALLFAVRLLMKILDGTAPVTLGVWLGGTIFLVVLRWAFSFFRGVALEKAERRVEWGLSVWFSRRLRTLSPNFYHEREADKRLMVAYDSIRAIGLGVETAMQTLQAVLQLAIFLPVLFVISFRLTLLVLVVVLPVISFVQKKMHAMKPSIEKEMADRGALRSAMEDSKRFFRLWSSPEDLSQIVRALFGKSQAVFESGMAVGKRSVALSQGMEALSVISVVGVLAFCAWMILQGNLDGEGLILYCSALFLCYKPVKECSRLLPQMRLSKSALGAMLELEKIPRKGRLPLHDKESLEFSQVDFSYSTKQTALKVFEGLNVSLDSHRPVLLKGPNGCGKSTFFKLVAGLEFPLSGNIRLPRKFASHGVFSVSQDLMLPPREFVRNRLKRLMENAAFDDFFQTVDGKRLFSQQGLSGGERAKVALLWALSSSSKLIILDEPFAFVAQKERSRILESFLQASASCEKWVLMASHDPLPESLESRFEILDFKRLKECV